MSGDPAGKPGKISFGFNKALPSMGTGTGSGSGGGGGGGGAKGVSIAFGGAGSSQRQEALSSSSSSSLARRTPVAFGVDDDEGDEEDANGREAPSRKAGPSSGRREQVDGQAKSKAPTRPLSGIAGAAPTSRAERQRQETALELDASVFDYDSVYDSMKAGERVVAEKREEEKRKRDPKYMDGYLASAEQRKLDRQRAEAKKIQRERDLEGDEYANTESFVTDAYKEQMEEMQTAEQKDKEREEEDRKKSRGVAGFYKDLLAEQDRAHQAAVSASLAAPPRDGKHQNEGEAGMEATEAAAQRTRVEEARQKGLNVRVNDDNEVVDERSLLSAGLNVLGGKRKATSASEDKQDDAHHQRHRTGRNATDRGERDGARDARALREAQRARHSRHMEEQMLALQREREEAEWQDEQERKRALMGRANVSGASSPSQQQRQSPQEQTSSRGGNERDRVAEARQRALERRKKRGEQERATAAAAAAASPAQ